MLSLSKISLFVLQKSSSSESLSERGSSDLKKSFDAVVFDVLKVTPEQYAVSHLFGSGRIVATFQLCMLEASVVKRWCKLDVRGKSGQIVDQ